MLSNPTACTFNISDVSYHRNPYQRSIIAEKETYLSVIGARDYLRRYAPGFISRRQERTCPYRYHNRIQRGVGCGCLIHWKGNDYSFTSSGVIILISISCNEQTNRDEQDVTLPLQLK